MKIKQLLKPKILILGFGREGQDNLKFLLKIGKKDNIGIADKNSLEVFPKRVQNLIRKHKINFYSGDDYLKAIKDYEVIIKSPGVPFKILPKKLLKGKILTSQTDIFFSNHKGTIIGITGTKGKSTTTTLIYKILKENLKTGKAKYKRVFLIGNIGKTVLSYLRDSKNGDIYVYELSCHQLHNLRQSPHIAVWTNIYREHLDYYKSFKDYYMSKANITLWQTEKDHIVYGADYKIVENIVKKSKAIKHPVKGKYYELDFGLAREVGKIMGVEDGIINKVFSKFKNLECRLEFVGEFKGIKFYNDSLATIPEATIFAIKKFGKGNIGSIFLGGYERFYNFKDLAKVILGYKIDNLILFPVTGERILNDIKNEAKKRKIVMPKYFNVNNMKDAVKIAFDVTPKGKISLLSCASPSYNLFKDYKDRGDQFKRYVILFGKEN